MKDSAFTRAQLDEHTKELLQKIEDENIKIDTIWWSLFSHVLGNRLISVNFVLGDFLDTPSWIRKAGSGLMIFLYKISGRKGKLHPIDYYMNSALNNNKRIADFFEHVRAIVKEKQGS